MLYAMLYRRRYYATYGVTLHDTCVAGTAAPTTLTYVGEVCEIATGSSCQLQTLCKGLPRRLAQTSVDNREGSPAAFNTL